jgi:tRNA(fMet)-specific endonuclease VapC
MGLILDTCLFIAEERNRFDLGGFLKAHTSELAAMSTVTVSELQTGVHFADTEERRLVRAKNMERQIELVRLIAFGYVEAMAHSKIVFALRRSGALIGAYDAIIAATALAHDWSVATLNISEFQRVPELKVIDASPWLVKEAP